MGEALKVGVWLCAYADLACYLEGASQKAWNRHEDTFLCVAHGAEPSNILWELADTVMSGSYTPKTINSFCTDGPKVTEEAHFL